MQALLADKNLGIMAMDRNDYIKAMDDQLLLDRKIYEIISKEKAKEYLIEFTSAFLEFILHKGNGIDDKELTHIGRSL